MAQEFERRAEQPASGGEAANSMATAMPSTPASAKPDAARPRLTSAWRMIVPSRKR